MISPYNRLRILTLALLSLCLAAQAQTLPDSDSYLNELHQGEAALAAQSYTFALRSFMNASQLDHGACVMCYLELSLTYVALKDWRNVAAMADKALTIATADKERAEAHNLKATAILAQGSPDTKKLPLAEEEYRAAAQLDPAVAPYHFSLGFMLIEQAHDAEAVQELRRFLELAPADPRAAIVKQWIAEPRRAREPFAPDFHVTSAQGEEISLASLKGKTVVLDFWATWCPPCREALPDLKDLVKKYPPEHFVLVSVSLDEDQNAWHDFVTKEKMNWPQVNDGKGELFKIFGLEDVPTYVVLAPDGAILERVVGTSPQQSIAYRLKDILAKQPELNQH